MLHILDFSSRASKYQNDKYRSLISKEILMLGIAYDIKSRKLLTEFKQKIDAKEDEVTTFSPIEADLYPSAIASLKNNVDNDLQTWRRNTINCWNNVIAPDDQPGKGR